jgi:hypothetical protein
MEQMHRQIDQIRGFDRDTRCRTERASDGFKAIKLTWYIPWYVGELGEKDRENSSACRLSSNPTLSATGPSAGVAAGPLGSTFSS